MMNRIFDASRYVVVVHKIMVTGAMFFECRVAELPGVVVYGTTEKAARTDMNYELSRLRTLGFKHADPFALWTARRSRKQKRRPLSTAVTCQEPEWVTG